jgi:hypothetical protein
MDGDAAKPRGETSVPSRVITPEIDPRFNEGVLHYVLQVDAPVEEPSREPGDECAITLDVRGSWL